MSICLVIMVWIGKRRMIFMEGIEMSEREILIKELEKIRWECSRRIITGEGRDTFDVIADFILADRKRIVEEAMTSAMNMVRYLLFDNSPEGIGVYEKCLRESIKHRVGIEQ